MIKKTVEYYCDSCNKKVENDWNLYSVEFSTRFTGSVGKEVCHDCLIKYEEKIRKVYREMFYA